jgi:hypothetical protein
LLAAALLVTYIRRMFFAGSPVLRTE